MKTKKDRWLQEQEVLVRDRNTRIWRVNDNSKVKKNNKMDYNFLGIPKEQYGFSTNKIIRFRKPSFDEASFVFQNDLILDISLQ